MMFVPGLRREMRVLALFLTVYFMSQTWTAVSSQTTATPALISNGKKSSTAASESPTPTTAGTPTPSTAAQSTTSQSPITTKASLIQTTPAPTGGRKFDGASFVGGIILGIVITIIFVFVFKWWQSRNKSYHSL